MTHVVIADDSAVMRRIVVRTLRQAGFDGWQVTEASDGADLVAKVCDIAPDLVLSDWNMPVQTGLEALRQIRAQGLTMPFGFITSEGSQSMRDEAASAGATFLVTKPFTADDVRDALAAVV